MRSTGAEAIEPDADFQSPTQTPGGRRWAGQSARLAALAHAARERARTAFGRRGPLRAFVFTGGANGGASQVGQLRALVEAGIAPDLVVGVSVGALHAAFTASRAQRDLQGGVVLEAAAVDELEATWREMSPERVFGRRALDPALSLMRSRSSLFSSNGIRSLIASMLGDAGDRDLGTLTLPVSVGTCDLSAAATRWWDQGPTVEILAASVAIPGLLPPVRLDEAWHLDGGVLDNIPVGRAVALGAREVYVLDASGSGPDPDPSSPLGVLLAAFDTVRAVHAREDLRLLDPRVRVHRLPSGRASLGHPLRIQDFSHSQDLMEAAYRQSASLLATVSRRWSRGPEPVDQPASLGTPDTRSPAARDHDRRRSSDGPVAVGDGSAEDDRDRTAASTAAN